MKWDERGLIPAVAQDAATGTVLMVAWMNAEALRLTLETGEAHFYSRSRASLWRKGETSGHTLAVREVRVDCDGDTLLVLCDPAGPACHTGKPSCFFTTLPAHREDDGPAGGVLEQVYQVIQQRKTSSAEKSYVRSLLDGGAAKINAKITEESGELCAELPAGPTEKVVHEAADLLFHVLVGLAARDVTPAQVFRELARRFGTSGHVEKASRKP